MSSESKLVVEGGRSSVAGLEALVASQAELIAALRRDNEQLQARVV